MALTDALGHLNDFRLLPGQADHLRSTTALLEGLIRGQRFADRAFDANWSRGALTSGGIEAAIPPKSNRRYSAEFDKELYKWHHLVKNFFAKLREIQGVYRGITMPCSKTNESRQAFIPFAAIVI